MENFAKYILEQKELSEKMEIAYYLAKKGKIHFNKSIVFKTEIARMFLEYSKIDINKNEVLTAVLLCNCKKVDSAQDIERVHIYAKEGANYLKELGFNERFCKICEEVNRYSGSEPREIESDVLELVDQFGGMLLNRPERAGFLPEEAIILLKERNLKNKENRLLKLFIEFVETIEKLEIIDNTGNSPLKKLVKIYNENEKIPAFIKQVILWYTPKVDKLILKEYNHEVKRMLNKIDTFDERRSLFSKETTKKIISKMCGQSDENQELEGKDTEKYKLN